MNVTRATTLAARAPTDATPALIDMTKTYRTRGCMGFTNPVRLLMVDGGGDKPVIGAYFIAEDNAWNSGRWTLEGRWFGRGDLQSGESGLDLILVQDAEPADLSAAAAENAEAEQGAQISRPGPDLLAAARNYLESLRVAKTLPHDACLTRLTADQQALEAAVAAAGGVTA
jgi:hypothetical protein